MEADAGLADVAHLEFDAGEGGKINGGAAEREVDAGVAGVGGEFDADGGLSGGRVEGGDGVFLGTDGGDGLGRDGQRELGDGSER